MIKLAIQLVVAAIVIALAFLAFTLRDVPENVAYGVTFSTFHAKELELDWKEVYRAALDNLDIRKFRIPAYWPDVEPARDTEAWSDLDYQVREAKAHDAKIILAIGRRLPRWPECHVPEWAKSLSWEEQKIEIKEYLTAVVNRYKDEPTITHWQVENEPYLNAFANEFCGDLDEAFLEEEIALVRQLDPHRPILVTDSGNLGTWMGAYRNGDSFGTSLYMYFWNPEVGQFKTKLPAIVYRMKERAMGILYGPKETFLIELSLEPWLTEPTADASLANQLSRMDGAKFDEIVAYARTTSFDQQYLWGVEWWYYMRTKDHPEFWEKAKSIFSENKAQ
ncbi:MAG: hypothetical protein A2854_00320 [Parcubacteria group bacterium RIFCSPHIGHO2_01_FULL_56_18]|nr:MAG: hypothetical protein A2854_00320 [Parcubacteria group bacterium RIFCSPHIGHO2_01_FULL_56_18]